MRRIVWVCVLVISCTAPKREPVIGPDIPVDPDPAGKYLFYTHGMVVSILGDNAINNAAPEWGPYQYSAILDTLRSRGFNVISEIRDKDVHDSVFVNKMADQISALLKAGVPEKNIIAVGASAGWNITLRVSAKLANPNLKYVMMGGCWPDTYKDFSDITVYGKLLSIYEESDPHQSCMMIFEFASLTNGMEIKLNTGLSHGFIYKGYKEWVDPVVDWYETDGRTATPTLEPKQD